MRKALLVLAGLWLSNAAHAAPLYTLPEPDAQVLDQFLSPAPGALRFATGLSYPLDIQRDGSWSHEDGEAVWQASLYAAGAKSLSFVFEDVVLPAGATLLVQGENGLEQGPYSADQVRGGRLWTALLPGQQVTLTLRTSDLAATRLTLGQAFYGVKQAGGYTFKHGACNIDTLCSQADDWQDQVDSTVLLQYQEGSSLFSCSGFLVNNTRNDGTPYILTANHCGMNASNQDSVQVYWRFEDDSCGNSALHSHPSPDPSFNFNGVEVLASGDSADFTLLVVGSAASPVTIPDSFQPFWSGWDATTVKAQSGAGVHHPSGEQKSISLFNSPPAAQNVLIDGRDVSAWRVVWDEGTTEQGSSGSGLWNQDGRAIGMLSGGGASCSSQSSPDFYGRLHVAWQESAACSGQLKCWLDPDASGALVHNGMGPDGVVTPTPSPTPSPTPTPTPTPSATPTPSPTATASPTPSPSASATPTPSTSPAPASGGGSGAGGGLLLLLVWLLGYRRKERVTHSG